MRKHGPSIAFVTLALIVVLLSGCASTPRERYAQAQDSYIAAVQTLVDARRAGVFDQETWNGDILPAIELGNDLLDQYGAATKAGQPADDINQRLQDVLRTLQPYIVEATTDGKEE